MTSEQAFLLNDVFVRAAERLAELEEARQQPLTDEEAAECSDFIRRANELHKQVDPDEWTEIRALARAGDPLFATESDWNNRLMFARGEAYQRSAAVDSMESEEPTDLFAPTIDMRLTSNEVCAIAIAHFRTIYGLDTGEYTAGILTHPESRAVRHAEARLKLLRQLVGDDVIGEIEIDVANPDLDEPLEDDDDTHKWN